MPRSEAGSGDFGSGAGTAKGGFFVSGRGRKEAIEVGADVCLGGGLPAARGSL